ncbi:hypothetical protein EV424DRAFT_1348839 [Suillus variegatus]|nr:hypothetical protein EV424DRAFT_1348839 [Suillus variegatus]
MSVYEPDVVRKLLSALEPKNSQKKFEASWNSAYEWEAEVVEYINYISDKTRTRSTKTLARPCLDSKVPILSPRFLPPSYLHAQKRNQSEPAINPEILYLKALCAIHPFYYPELAKCLRCNGTDNVQWDGWTGTGPRDVHGLMVDEAAIAGPTGPFLAGAGDIPVFFHRCAVTQDLFNLLVEMRPSSTAGSLAENI